MTTVQATRAQAIRPLATRVVGALLGPLVASTVLASGCAPSTKFFNEGPGQPPDRSSTSVPPGSLGVCKLPGSKRPPIVDKALWEHAPSCKKDTPRRFVQVGYGRAMGSKDPLEDKRMQAMMEVLKQSVDEADANSKMLRMMRSVRQQGRDNPRLLSRIERASGRTYSCDYHYLLRTTAKHLTKKGKETACPAVAWDPEKRQEACLFDTTMPEAVWLTSSWGCVAFTGTLGEGQSCYRMCEYDDYCASQVSCASPDMDLLLCALGVCLPEKVAGIY